MINVLYESGRFWVRREQFGKTLGFAVYENDGTVARRVARIGFAGEAGLRCAIIEANRRACDQRPMAREWLNLIWGNASGAYYKWWREAARFKGPIPRGWMWYGIPRNLR